MLDLAFPARLLSIGIIFTLAMHAFIEKKEDAGDECEGIKYIEFMVKTKRLICRISLK